MANKIQLANIATGERVEISNGVIRNGVAYYLSKSEPKGKWCDKYHVKVNGFEMAGAYTKYIIEPQDGWEFVLKVEDKTKESAPAPKRSGKKTTAAPKKSAPEPRTETADKFNPLVLWSFLKSSSEDVVFFIRHGGSYVTFNQDAELVAKKLALTPTTKNDRKEVSVPADMLRRYLPILVKAGIAYQLVDDPMKQQPGQSAPSDAPKSTDGEPAEGSAESAGAEATEQAPAQAPEDAPAKEGAKKRGKGGKKTKETKENPEQKAEGTAENAPEELPEVPEDAQEIPEEIPEKEDEEDNIDETAKAIAEALRQARMKNGGKGEVDEDKVRKIVHETLDEMAKTEPAKVKKVKAKAADKDSYRHPMFDKVLAMVANDRAIGRFPWLYGPAGSGKSTLAQHVAEALDLPFYSVSSLQQKYELEGYSDAVGKLVETTFYKAFNEGGVFIFDEMSTTSGEVQVAFNTAVAQLIYNFPVDGMKSAHPDFHIIAADNTTGWGGDKKYHARFELDASTLDRYMPVEIAYTDEHDLKMAQGDKDLVAFLKDVRKVLDDADLTYTASPRVSKCMKTLQAIGIYSDKEIMNFGLCGGWNKQDIRMIAARLDAGKSKYHKTFVELSK